MKQSIYSGLSKSFFQHLISPDCGRPYDPAESELVPLDFLLLLFFLFGLLLVLLLVHRWDSEGQHHPEHDPDGAHHVEGKLKGEIMQMFINTRSFAQKSDNYFSPETLRQCTGRIPERVLHVEKVSVIFKSFAAK